MQRNKEILLVEDDMDDVLLLEELLREKGTGNGDIHYKLLHVRNIEEAKEKLQEDSERFAALLLDLYLAQSSGLETVHKITPYVGTMPLIVLTRLSDEDLAIQCLSDGASDYLIKGDVTRNSLLKAIRFSIERKQLQLRIDADREKKAQEREIKLLQAKNQQLLEVNMAIEKKAQELERLNEELEQFSYVATHDLKEPIIGIEGHFAYVKAAVSAANEEALESVEFIEKSIEQAKNTIDNLVKVTKVQKAEDLPQEKLKFEVLLREVKDSLSVIIKSSSTDIQSEFEGCPEVVYPRIHLYSILYNLVSNAVKYGPKDKKAIVKVRSFIKGDRIFLSIVDNGVGMDLKRDPDKIFRMFKRLNTSVEGSGMGLYIVKKIVESRGGEISVTSEPGEGTCFLVNLKQME